jgi:two-component system chemotaxis response regulator CheY
MAKRILIIDDSPSMRQMLVFTLGGAGYEVVEAEDGGDGLDKLNTDKLNGSRLNMIITDLNMPNLNGFDFIRAVREIPEYKYVPIIVLTTESGSDKMGESCSAGATGWITKPFKPEQLLGVVEKVMT